MSLELLEEGIFLYLVKVNALLAKYWQAWQCDVDGRAPLPVMVDTFADLTASDNVE